jgi:3-oxoacyl-[acyl-carrier protein] reductase
MVQLRGRPEAWRGVYNGMATLQVPALLSGRTALVTGGTRGIGRGIAEVLCAAGARVVITGRDVVRGQKAAAEISPAGCCQFAQADARSLPDMEAAAGHASGQFGSLDVLVHNAGVYPEVLLEEMTEADWDLVHDTNLKGTFFAFRACLPFLKQSAGGRIVLVSSITGPVTGYPGLAHYGAGLGAQAIEAMEALIPLKRLGQPADVAGAVLYLASGLASFVTGQSLVVDGGQTLPEIPG